jgi:hypothetical protein
MMFAPTQPVVQGQQVREHPHPAYFLVQQLRDLAVLLGMVSSALLE